MNDINDTELEKLAKAFEVAFDRLLKKNTSRFTEMFWLESQVGPQVWSVLGAISLSPSSSIYHVQKIMGTITYPQLLTYVSRLENIGLVKSRVSKSGKRKARLLVPSRAAWEFLVWIGSRRSCYSSDERTEALTVNPFLGSLCTHSEVLEILKQNDPLIMNIFRIAQKCSSNKIQEINDSFGKSVGRVARVFSELEELGGNPVYAKKKFINPIIEQRYFFDTHKGIWKAASEQSTLDSIRALDNELLPSAYTSALYSDFLSSLDALPEMNDITPTLNSELQRLASEWKPYSSILKYAAFMLDHIFSRISRSESDIEHLRSILAHLCFAKEIQAIEEQYSGKTHAIKRGDK